METTSSHESKTKIDLLDSIESDDFDVEFRPITQGLGFQKLSQNDEEVKVQIKSLKRERQKSVVNKKAFKAGDNISRGELDQFYNSKKRTPSLGRSNDQIGTALSTPNIPSTVSGKISEQLNGIGSNQVTTSEKVVTSNLFIAERIMAYIIDVFIVACLVALTTSGLLYISGFTFDRWMEFLTIFDVQLYIAGLFAIFYLFYFSFFDSGKAGTLGKALIGIKLVTFQAKTPNIGQAMARGFISLIFMLAFGLPHLLRLADSATETNVIRED